MNIEQTLATLTPEIVDRLRTAVELGKWPSGQPVSAEQRATCMQAVLVWEHAHLPENQRTGYIDKGKKAEGELCDSDTPAHDPHEEKPLRLV